MPPDFARADALRARLDGAPVDHARFTGPPVDVKDWTPEELGVVWGALHRAARFGHDDIARRALASTLLEQVTQACLAPLLAGEAFLDALDAAGEYNGEWEYVVACLACLQGEVPAGTAAQARRILGKPRAGPSGITRRICWRAWPAGMRLRCSCSRCRSATRAIRCR